MTGAAATPCLRASASIWARFFPLHDLTHYAVETVLGHRRGFYGLVAEGWNLTDFGAPWPRGPLPLDAEPSELIVGFMDAQRANGEEWSAAELNERLREHCTRAGIELSCEVSDRDLERIRGRIEELFAGWAALPPGETLALDFVR